jgi:hypothetical protein
MNDPLRVAEELRTWANEEGGDIHKWFDVRFSMLEETAELGVDNKLIKPLWDEFIRLAKLLGIIPEESTKLSASNKQWATEVVEGHSHKPSYITDLISWWQTKGRTIYGDEESRIRVTALRWAMDEFVFKKISSK